MAQGNDTLDFHGETLILDRSGAVFIAARKTLLVADLHFEKGSSLAQKGMVVPPYDTASSLANLAEVIIRTKAQLLVCLGDSFHDTQGPDRLGDKELEQLDALAKVCDIIWITGNHDPAIGGALPGSICDMLNLGALVLRHEPTREADGEICGHLHPTAVIRQRGRRLRRKCFAGNQHRLFLPAFGAYTGGLNVRHEAFEPFWNEAAFTVWMIGKTDIHKFPSRVLL